MPNPPSSSSLEDSFVSIQEKTEALASTQSRKTSSSSSTNNHYDHHCHRPLSSLSSSSSSLYDETKDPLSPNYIDPRIPRRLVLKSRRADVIPTLKHRLAETRYPDQIEAAGWSYGIGTNVLKNLTREWLHSYDWERELAILNRDHDHWTCRVNGLDLHYVRFDPWAGSIEGEESGDFRENPYASEETVNDKGEIIMPLLLIHGWPGSWYEFAKALKLLKKRGRYQIIVPSLPGFGWSQAPTQKGFGVRAMAKILHDLMQQLGYKHYVVQGGDWGGIISRAIATLYPEHCLAIHVNMLPCLPPRPWSRPIGFLKAISGFLAPQVVYKSNPREKESIEALKLYAIQEGAYFFVQSTKPQTLGHALLDSPVGLLSWLGEKYLSWADLDPVHPGTWPFSKTELLTQIMIYHSTESITSSTRIYYETYQNNDLKWLLRRPVPASVPVGVGVWKKELFMVPRAWADDWMNVVSWHEFPKGGHFAAFERPVEWEKEIVDFFTSETILDLFTAKRHGFKI